MNKLRFLPRNKYQVYQKGILKKEVFLSSDESLCMNFDFIEIASPGKSHSIKLAKWNVGDSYASTPNSSVNIPGKKIDLYLEISSTKNIESLRQSSKEANLKWEKSKLSEKIINNYTKSIKIDLVSSRGSSGSSKKSTCWCLHFYFYLGRDKASKFKVNVLSERQKGKA